MSRCPTSATMALYIIYKEKILWRETFHDINKETRGLLCINLQDTYKANLYTRIDSFQLCETEHFLNWGVLRYQNQAL